ncbi:hypothetical protein S7711_09301 [Stachybotrys chartarum IBT 7711]|uniref:Uncharacterized protein n=1 Tax=Stachybotrys chartarum (strain CBS 109288 / IBT 7711) TaxID=1280523 RepID=A0A084BCF5_STACB|nr:hypothetical protein S7711_09301 [Stachybotrys chartarum IBT 7711]
MDDNVSTFGHDQRSHEDEHEESLIIERVHAAIHQNDLHLLAELLSKNLALIHASSFKGTYLAVAVSCDNAAAVRILLDHGASPLEDESSGDEFLTILEFASFHGNREIWWLLFDRFRGLTPTGIEICGQGEQELVDKSLFRAAESGSTIVVGDFLDELPWSHKTIETALICATQRWQADVVDFLLDKFQFGKDTLKKALDAAVGDRLDAGWPPNYKPGDWDKHYRVVSRFVDAAGIDVRLPEHGPALLGQAVRRFEKQGADPNTHWENGVTALHLFAFPLDKNCLERSDAPWERMPKHNFGRDGATPSHLAAEAADRDTFIHHFLPAESGLTSTNRFGESLLHYAAAGGRHDILDYLLSRYGDRFNVNAANNFGWTPLICALAPNRRTSKFEADAVKSARLLLSYGADLKEWVDEDPSSPGDRYIFDVDGNAIECWEGMSEPERQRELAYPDPDTSAEALACELLSKSSELLPPIQSPAKLFYGSSNSKSYMISTARHPYDKERLGGKASKACAEAE